MKEVKKEYILKDIDELIPYINNPRNNDDAVDAVASSIKNFGFNSPIVIDENNEIINGHTRLKASKKLGLKKVPCVKVTGLSKGEKKAYRLADNKTGEIATWDFDLLDIELEQISDMDIDFSMDEFGFEIDDLKEVLEDEYDVDKKVDSRTKLGDIWQLGRHKLMCGDSTNEDAVKKLVGGDKHRFIDYRPTIQCSL